MHVIKGERVVYVDVDDTLIIWPHTADKLELTDTPISFSISDKSKIVAHVHHRMIEFVRNLKAQDVTLVAWSHAGPRWAEYVVKELGLEAVIDLVVAKPFMMLDDKPVEHLGNTTWLPPIK